MRKNRCFKLIAWLLSVIMILNMMPIAALAEEPVADNAISDPETETIDNSTGYNFITPDTPQSGDSSGDSSGGSSGGSISMSMQYIRTEDKAVVSMKEGDPDPNKEYYIEIKFDPGTADVTSITDLYFPLDYVKVTGTLPSKTGEYTCHYEIDPENPNKHGLEFNWELEAKKTAFTVQIACTPAFPEVYGYGGHDYAIVSNKTNAMMVSGQTKFTSSNRKVIKSASCTIMSNGKVRNNDLEDTTIYWTFTHVSGQWYKISYGGQNIKFDNDESAVLTSDSVSLRILQQSEKQIIVTDDYNKYLTSCKDNPAAGFGSYTDVKKEYGKGQEMNLYTAADMTRRPTMDMTNGLAIVNESMENKKVLTASGKNNTTLNIAAYNLVADGKVMVTEEGMTAATWDFVQIDDKERSDWYYIKSHDGEQYLNLSSGKVTVSGTPTPIFVRHIEKSTTLFVLSDSPYTNTNWIKDQNVYPQPNLVQYEDAIAKANNAYPKVTKSNHHLYEASDYTEGYKLSLRPVAGADENFLYLTFNYNGGKVTPLTGEVAGRPLDDQNRIKVNANEEIELPKLETTGNQKAFVGWSTSPNFYKAENGTTYHDFYPAETPAYKMPANSTTLYAVYDTTNTTTLFSIRRGLETATIPHEPGNGDEDHKEDKYTHVEEYLTTKDTLKTPVWVIDTNGTGNISSVTGGYLINSVTDNLKYIPDDAKIAAAIDGYDPETMYVHWYAIKYTGDNKSKGGGWHVDGVIRKRPTVNVTITGKTGTLVYNGQEQTVEGFDVSIDTPGTNLKTTDIKLADGKFAIAAGTDANPDGEYKMGLQASYFVNTNPQYHVVITIPKDGDGWLKITKRPVTLKANDASNEYTGSEVAYNKAEGAVAPYYDFVDDPAIDNANEGLVTGHSITAITLSGSGKTVTKQNEYYPITIDQNSVKIGDGTNDFTANYDITVKEGKLTITQNSTAIKVEPASGSKTYDGKPLTKTAQEDFTVSGKLPTGFTWEATANGTVTNVTPGSNENPVNAITSFKIFDTDHNDVTDQFSNIDTTATGTLTIIARPLHLTAKNASNDYTGEEITYATASDAKKPYYDIENQEGVEDGLAEGQSITAITLSGAGTDVKAEGYPITIDKNSVQIGTYTDNYDISVTPGTLTIKAIEFTVTELKDVTYNGEAQEQEVTVTDSLKKTLVKDTDYEVSYSTDTTNAGTVTVTVTGKGNHTGTVTTTYEILKRKITVYDEDTRDFSGDDETLTIGANKASNVVTGETLTLTDAKITGKAADTYETVSDYTWSVAKEDGTDSTDNYSIEVTGKLVISPIGFTVADLGNVTYNGEAQEQEVTVTDSLGNTLVKDTDYEVSYSTDTTNVGTVTVTVTGKGNYTGTATKTYEILKRKITVYDEDTRDYNGGNRTLTIGADKAEGVVTGETLTLTDATITGKAADTYTTVSRYSWRVVKANGTDSTKNYSIEVTGKLVISPIGFTVADLNDVTYNSKVQAQEVTVTDSLGKTLVKDTDYEVSYSTDTTNAGTVTVTVTGKGNYSGTTTKTYEILKRKITVYDEDKRDFSGEDETLTIGADKASNVVTGETLTLTDATITGKAADTYEAVSNYSWSVAKADGTDSTNNYSIEVTGKLVISPIGFTVADLGNVTYNGEAQEQEVTVTDSLGNTLVKDTDYEVSYSTDTTNAGTVTVTVTGKGNYTGTVTKTYTIDPAKITVYDEDTRDYNGGDQTLTIGADKAEGVVTGETLTLTDATVTGKAANTYTKVGNYSWSVAKADESDSTKNYTIEVTGKLTIGKKAITLTVDAKNKTYGDADPAFTASFGENDLAGGDTISYTLSRVEGENAGTYAISTSIENANYDVTVVPADLTISKKAITLTADAKNKTYGDEDPTFTASFGENDLVGEDTISYTLSRVEGENVGTYAISTSIENANYDVTVVPADLTIGKKAITLTVDAKNKTYGDEDPAFTANFGENDLVGRDTISYTLSRAEGENVGTYAISTSIENANYDVTVVPADLTISKKAITLTADAKSKTYGDEDPAFTASFGENDLVGEDTISYTLSRAEGENVGTYAISTSIESANYDVTVVAADLTINPKAVTVTAEAKSKTYGEEDPELTAVVEGNLEGETINYTLAREEGEDAGEYGITVTLGENSNYTVEKADSTLTIDKVEEVHVKITAHGGEFTYDTQNHTVTGYDVEIDNPLYTEEDFLFSGNASVTRRNAGTSNMGLSAADFSNLSNNFDNVVFEVTNRNLVIAPKAATITVQNKFKTYGEADPLLTATVDGLAGTDAVIPMMSREPGENVGTYTVNATVTPDPNYTFTIVPGGLTISPKTLTVTADAKIKTFGGDEPGLSVTIDGLVDGDTADMISYTLERESGENVGSYRINAIGSEFQGNYNVVFGSAEMTIVPEDTVVVRITANKGEYQYDGTERDLSGYEVEINNDLYSEEYFTFTGSSELKATNAGTYRTAMTAEDFTNDNPNFENVVFEVTNGELVITKRQVTLTSGDAEKAYDGRALKSDEITVGGDGFAEGEGLIYNVTGSITNPGTAENTFNWFAAEGTLEDNYDITKTTGTLTVLPSTTHTLTIRYETASGRDISTFKREYAVGEQYEVVTPAMSGYAADEETISGIMGNADVTITVTYSPILYTLTIHYTAVGEDGEIAEPTVLHLAAGEEYRVPVAQVAGYESLIDVITGTMPANDRSITVMMIGEEASKILGRGRPTMIIEDERTALGIDNAVLGSGEIIE